MREVLADILRQTSGLVDVLKVVGTPESTHVEGWDQSKTLVVRADLRNAIPDFAGEFCVPNVGLLNGLLNFTSYQTEGATFRVKRRQRGEREIVEEFQFRDAKGMGADYRLSVAASKPLEVHTLTFESAFEPEKSRLNEFQQLAKLYSEVEKTFGLKIEDRSVIAQLGTDNSSTHRASVVLATNVGGAIRVPSRWMIEKFFAMLKTTANPLVGIATNGLVLRVTAETQHGVYNYYLLGEHRRT